MNALASAGIATCLFYAGLYIIMLWRPQCELGPLFFDPVPIPIIFTFLIALASALISTRGQKDATKPASFLTILKTYALYLVGGHLVLGVILIITEMTHGIDDMDSTYLIALLVHYLNLPTRWVLESLRVTPEIFTVVLAGTLQWASLAVALAAVHYAIKSGVGVVTRTFLVRDRDDAGNIIAVKKKPGYEEKS